MARSCLPSISTASGVLATLTAGLVRRQLGFLRIDFRRGKRGVLHHWEFVAFLINSLIFMLIGGREATIADAGRVRGGRAGDHALAARTRGGGISGDGGIQSQPAVRTLGRTSTSCSGVGCAAHSRWHWRWRLPRSIPERSEIIVVAFAVVAFSIFVQGLTMPWLIERQARAASTRPRPSDQGTSTVSTATGSVSG